MLHEVFKNFKKIITVEDGCIQGGVGSAILEFMVDHKYQAEVVRLGIPDEIVDHGEQEDLWNNCHYDSQAIISEVKKMTAGIKIDSMVS